MAGRRGQETVRDMVLTLAVLMTAVGLFVLLLPKSDRDPVQAVEYRSELSVLAAASPYPLLVPTGLPDTWRVTSIRTAAPQPGADAPVATLHLGQITPGGQYAGLEETNGPADAFVQQQVGPVLQAGVEQIEGRSWDLFVKDGKRTTTSLVLRDGPVTVVVTGGASLSELRTLAASLQPAQRPPGA